MDERSHTRSHGIFADKCPVYRTLKAVITMTTELIFVRLMARGEGLCSRAAAPETPKLAASGLQNRDRKGSGFCHGLSLVPSAG